MTLARTPFFSYLAAHESVSTLRDNTLLSVFFRFLSFLRVILFFLGRHFGLEPGRQSPPRSRAAPDVWMPTVAFWLWSGPIVGVHLKAQLLG